MKKLAIITTHPIQYYAPIFQLLNQRQQIKVKIFYTLGNSAASNFDPEFAKHFTWDVDLLSGYEFEWVTNSSRRPGSHRFNGIINPTIIAQIDSFRPDDILVIGWAYNGHLKALRHYYGKIPVYFRGDSTLLDEEPGAKVLIKKLLLRCIYHKVDYALYVGSNNRNYFERYGLKNNQLIYAPHAVDNDRFSVARAEQVSRLRKSLNVIDTDILILFAGKFIAKKNPLLLIEAVKNMNESNVHLLLVGDGELHSELIKAANSNPNIHFLGFQNQSVMPVIYQACNVFCLPSQGPGETWGLAVNEAMACGKAIVVSDKCGCAPELVQPGVNGYVFKSNHLVDLIDSLKLLCDQKKLQSFGEASREIIKGFSFLKIAEAIEGLVNETQRPHKA